MNSKSEAKRHHLFREVLRTKGKTFWFASFFLDKDAARNASILYAFCRLVDDLADEGGKDDTENLNSLAVFFSELGANPVTPKVENSRLSGLSDDEQLVVNEFLGLDLPVAVTQILIEGVLGDTQDVFLENTEAVVKYSYSVAGTVGLLMAMVLGTRERNAYFHAIDLGIAMQLTNICRDVLEDATMGRRYIPIEYDCQEILGVSDGGKRAVSCAIESLLKLADSYYESGLKGIAYLPRRSRPAVFLMTILYREIGNIILKRNLNWWVGRAYVPFSKKVFMTICALPRAFRIFCVSPITDRRRIKHKSQLHGPLAGMPGANE
jgi:phytoene synthase